MKILNRKEKKYLKNVLKPFKDRFIIIRKVNHDEIEFISIILKKGKSFEYAYLPSFEKNTLFKNMELNKQYTLKELGL